MLEGVLGTMGRDKWQLKVVVPIATWHIAPESSVVSDTVAEACQCLADS